MYVFFPFRCFDDVFRCRHDRDFFRCGDRQHATHGIWRSNSIEIKRSWVNNKHSSYCRPPNIDEIAKSFKTHYFGWVFCSGWYCSQADCFWIFIFLIITYLGSLSLLSLGPFDKKIEKYAKDRIKSQTMVKVGLKRPNLRKWRVQRHWPISFLGSFRVFRRYQTPRSTETAQLFLPLIKYPVSLQILHPKKKSFSWLGQTHHNV